MIIENIHDDPGKTSAFTAQPIPAALPSHLVISERIYRSVHPNPLTHLFSEHVVRDHTTNKIAQKTAQEKPFRMTPKMQVSQKIHSMAEPTRLQATGLRYPEDLSGLRILRQ
jgi:hypothetical protein